MKRTVFCLLALLHAGLFYAETIGRSDAQATARAFLASRGITMQASDAAYRGAEHAARRLTMPSIMCSMPATIADT